MDKNESGIMTLPVVVIVGRPNVGKSTLFNTLTQTKAALVADFPGVTRDRQYGMVDKGAYSFLLVDTGGMGEITDLLSELMESQIQEALREADCIIYVVDAQTGLMPDDKTLADRLRKTGKAVILAVNKMDGKKAEEVRHDFYALGLGEPHPISAKRKRGLEPLFDAIRNVLPETHEEINIPGGVKIGIIGRPNVGKSTLVNRLLGEERMIVADHPGTTRESIYIPFQHHGQNYVLIDTAGIRRRARIHDAIEKFSVIKSFQTIKESDVIIFMMDASMGEVTDQDLRLIQFIMTTGNALVIIFNKWDHLTNDQRQRFRDSVDRRMKFVDFARQYFTSALQGTGMRHLFRAIDEAYRSSQKELSTADLTKVLEQAVNDHQPPLVKGRRIRLRYAHLGKRHPLSLIIHGKQTESLPLSYARYLDHYFREAFSLKGAVMHLKFKTDINPYQPS